MKLCLLKVSVLVNLSYLFFFPCFPILLCFLAFLKLLFLVLFSPLRLVFVNRNNFFFRYWGSSVCTSNQLFSLKTVFVIRNDFFFLRYWGSSVHTSKLRMFKKKKGSNMQGEMLLDKHKPIF